VCHTPFLGLSCSVSNSIFRYAINMVLKLRRKAIPITGRGGL
jgi:hypothetical protein